MGKFHPIVRNSGEDSKKFVFLIQLREIMSQYNDEAKGIQDHAYRTVHRRPLTRSPLRLSPLQGSADNNI